MAVFWRLWATASATLVVAVLIFVTLTLLQFRTIQRTLLAERVAVLAGNTAEPFESAAMLGLPLASVRNAEALLERARQTDDAIVSIRLVEPGGRVLHQIGEGLTAVDRLPLPAGWADRPTNLFDGGRFLSFTPVAGPDGGALAAIVVRLDASASINRIWAMGAELATAAAFFLAAGGLATGLALRRVFAAEIGAFDAIERDIELSERGIWRGEGAGAGDGSGFRQLLSESRRAYHTALASGPARDRGG